MARPDSPIKSHEYFIARRPRVAWEITGRKTFLRRVPEKIRESWKVGDYSRLRGAARG